MTIIDIISSIIEFEDAYKAAANDNKIATKFWNMYNPYPHELMNKGQYHNLRERMFTLLRICKRIDTKAYEKIHKGHPYFFIGISSFRLKDYQTAISFFDAALSEDQAIGDGEERPTDLFFKLQGENPNNASQKDTQLVQSEVESSIENYNKMINHNSDIHEFDLDQLDEYFISFVLEKKNDAGLRTMLTTFITFIVEWNFRDSNLGLGIKKGTAEPLFMHLFRGCVLFESLLSRNPHPKEKHKEQKDELGKLINYYKKELHLPKEWSLQHNNKEDFKDLKSLLEYLNEFDETIDHSIKVSRWLRNNLGHSIAWEDTIDREAYNKLFLFVSTACLHVINCLWSSPN